MVKKKKVKSAAKRFGSRYGRKLRDKVAFIEGEKRKSKKCPYCNYIQVKRLAVGIWHCKKCDSKFTGKAYTIKTELKFEKSDGKKEEGLSRKRLRASQKKEEGDEQEEKKVEKKDANENSLNFHGISRETKGFTREEKKEE